MIGDNMSRNIGGMVERLLLPMVTLGRKLPVRNRLQTLFGTNDPLISQITGFAMGSGRVIDIGANDGMFTYAFARVAARVEAFEPQPELARQISRFGDLSQRNISVHCCGLSNDTGTMTLRVPLIKRKFRSPHVVTGLATFRPDNDKLFLTEQLLDVPVKRLDDFNFSDVTLIKIDVEGHEAQVIDGATQTLERCRPIIVVELEKRHVGKQCMLETIERLQGMRYSGFFFKDNSLVSIDRFDLKTHQADYPNAEERYRAYCAGTYINNFVFQSSGLA